MTSGSSFSINGVNGIKAIKGIRACGLVGDGEECLVVVQGF